MSWSIAENHFNLKVAGIYTKYSTLYENKNKDSPVSKVGIVEFVTGGKVNFSVFITVNSEENCERLNEAKKAAGFLDQVTLFCKEDKKLQLTFIPEEQKGKVISLLEALSNVDQSGALELLIPCVAGKIKSKVKLPSLERTCLIYAKEHIGSGKISQEAVKSLPPAIASKLSLS